MLTCEHVTKAIGMIGLLLVSWVHAASFDCSKDRNAAEHLICSDKRLNTLDERLGAEYKLSLDDMKMIGDWRLNALIDDENAWIRQRNRCEDATCISKVYESRLKKLQQMHNAELLSDRLLDSSDQTFADLYNRLDPQYRYAYWTARSQQKLQTDQWTWITDVRSQCTDAACMIKAYQDRLEALARVPTAGWKKYTNSKLGISFEYLANLNVVSCDDIYGPNGVCLTSDDMPNIPDRPAMYYVMAFHVEDVPLDKAAEKSAVFIQKNGKWVTDAGQGTPQVAISFSGHDWVGLKAVITCGISDENGYHAGAGDCFWAVVSNGKRSVVIDTQGTSGLDDATMHSVKTLRLLLH